MDIPIEDVKNHLRKAIALEVVGEVEIKYLFIGLTQKAVLKSIMEGYDNTKAIADRMKTYPNTVVTAARALADKGYITKIRGVTVGNDIYKLTDELSTLIEEWRTV